MGINSPDEVIVTLDLAMNKLYVRGQNFSFACDKDAELGPRLRTILQVRAIEATRGFATGGAPSAEFMRHKYLHKNDYATGCPWCEEKKLKLQTEAREAAKIEEEHAQSMAQARKFAARRREQARKKQQAELRKALLV